MIKLPEQFIKTIKDIHKEKGEIWLENFEDLCKKCEIRWNMKILSPFELSYNFVAPIIIDGQSNAVIKLAVPNAEFNDEIEALNECKDADFVKVIDSDPDEGILILEQLLPGNTLASIENEEEAMLIAVKVMKNLWKKPTTLTKLPTILNREKSFSRIVEKFPNGIGPFSKDTLLDAFSTFKEMNKSQTTQYLLHGDLHHYNLLNAGENTWKVIDPKGLVGEREYDLIQFLLNNLEGKDISKTLERRIERLVNELDLNKERLLLWGYSHAVLSTCWSLEDEGTYNEYFFNAINIFKQLHKKLYSC
ncbi:aminoglycoside phosphotransferase family protein [Bacillus sp. AFS041924]|uniref:aminoglycoside phosphotransferase family protein n=1 Tax=Bacillus sp. AFS041924 TaxID=2033503 RepID=UPI000BFB3AF7|nr:aminoglycoside phosphotransferase family protein [Bacillus sp. AFS041924]PGS53392.1 hydrogenase expression protein HypB [Bacillus sp. AFS041924]